MKRMRKTALQYGIYLFAALMVFFLTMQIMGYGERYDFRIFNVVIQSVIVYLGVRHYARSTPNDYNYLSGTMSGILVTLVGVIPFAIFQMINLAINPAMMNTLQEAFPVFASYLNPFTAGLIVLAEGTAVGLVLSYLCMRIVDWKEVSAKKPYLKTAE